MSKSIAKTLGVFAFVFITLLSGCTLLPDALVPKSDEARMANEPLELLDDVTWGDYQKAAYTIYSGEKEAGTVEIEVMKSEALDAYEIIKVKRTGTTEI